MNGEHKFKILMFCVVLTVLVVWVNAGNLNPPAGPVTGTMKSLDTIEPRIPIASLPFSISAPGSYYVAKDLTGTTGQHGIIINSSDVSIDLKGFALHGGAGTLDGITVTGPRSRISICNGKLSAWDGVGINTLGAHKVVIMYLQTEDNGRGSCGGSDHHVMYMQADGNQTDGIECGDNCVLVDCTCIGTITGPGIKTGDGCKVENCVSSNNAGHGIAAGSGSIVTICTARANGVDGINVGDGCTVKHCTVRANNNDGIEAAAQCLVLENNATGNGPGVNDGAGIHVAGSPGGGSRVESNNATNNDRNFEVNNTGNIIVKNSSTGGGTGGVGGTGYYIAAGNAVGAITPVAGNPSITVSAWVNFQY